MVVCTESQPSWLVRFCTTVPVSSGLQEVRLRTIESEARKVVMVVCTESQPSWLVRFCMTVPVSSGLQEVRLRTIESDARKVVMVVCTESQPSWLVRFCTDRSCIEWVTGSKIEDNRIR